MTAILLMHSSIILVSIYSTYPTKTEIIASRTLQFIIKSSLDQQHSRCNEGILNVYIDFLRKKCVD